MSKTCKDFGEVLVALGQGKIVVTDCGWQFTFKRGMICYRKSKDYLWNQFGALRPDEFSYPAPIYEEPKTVDIDMWVNVYLNSTPNVYNSREMADSRSHNRIACINIKRTVTKGEGL